MNPSYETRRRSSIFGGLLLIVIGILLLIHSLAPGWLHLAELARYWPVLLILWGLARLWDHLAARRMGQAPPRAVSGSDLLLLLLVLVGVLAVVAYNRLHRHITWDSDFDLFGQAYSFTDTLPPQPVEPSARLDLWTPRGNITVHGQQEKTLSLAITKTVRAANQGEARKVADRITVTLQATPQAVHVEPKIPSGGDSVRLSYDVSVFPKISLNASTGRGEVNVSGID